MRWAGHVHASGCREIHTGHLVGKFESRKQLERPRRRWLDNIKANVGVVWEGVEWILLAQEREQRHVLVNT